MPATNRLVCAGLTGVNALPASIPATDDYPASAKNAGLMAVAMLAVRRPDLRERLRGFRERQAQAVRSEPLE